MSIDPDRVRAALDIMGPGTAFDIAQERIGLLRYSQSRVTAQHSEERLRVRVRVSGKGNVASGTLETLEPGAVRALARHLRSALDRLPEDAAGGRSPRTAPHDTAATPAVGKATLTAGAAERFAWFSAIRDGLPAGELGGSIRHDVVHRVMADHDGLYRDETLTKAALLAIAERDGRSASVRRVHRDAARIGVEDIPDLLGADLTPLDPCEPLSGTFRILLKPQAVITLLATYGYAALGAAGYAEGRTAVAGRMGEPVTSELLTLTDDGTDPDGLPSGFDPEGTARRRTPLIQRGKLVGVVSDLARAEVTGGRSTGHAVPAGWRFGADPTPSHLLLDPGATPDSDLLSVCGDGLAISRLDYLRILHPKDTLVSGMTRDATHLVRDGKVVAWHPPVRLTFRMSDVLRAVVAVGRGRERGEAVFMESVVAPSVVVEAGAISL